MSLGNNIISWSTKKQTMIARSSTEAKFRIVANVAAKVVWTKSFKRNWISQVVVLSNVD